MTTGLLRRTFIWAASLLLLTGSGGSLALAAEPLYTTSLSIQVVGLKSNQGQVRIAVFNSAESWLDEPVYATILDVDDGALEWQIVDVPHGDYGIAAFHDENQNGRNDRNFLGIPKESYAFSNNTRARFGPPKWKKASFSVSGESQVVVIEIR